MAGGAKTTKHLEGYQAYFGEKFSEIKDIMVKMDYIEKLHTTIKGQSEKIHILESRIPVMERHISVLFIFIHFHFISFYNIYTG